MVYNFSMKLSMGATEISVGLTEKAVRLEQGMRAAFKELITEGDSEKIMVEEGVLRALKRRFDDLWKPFGIKRTPLHDALIGVLQEGPKTLAEIFETLKSQYEEFEEFEKLDRRTFTKSAGAMLDADLITGDERRMWFLG